MTNTNDIPRHIGMWRLTLTSPAAAVEDLGPMEVTVRGFAADDMDRSNLTFHACEKVAQIAGYKSYDDVPESWTPMGFSDPVLTTNEWVAPDGGQQWFVGVYDVTRCYGGPEEGGQWYDAGHLIRQTAVNSYAEAEALREQLQEQFGRTDKRYSVLGGDDYDIVVGIEPHEPEFPTEPFRYE